MAHLKITLWNPAKNDCSDGSQEADYCGLNLKSRGTRWTQHPPTFLKFKVFMSSLLCSLSPLVLLLGFGVISKKQITLSLHNCLVKHAIWKCQTSHDMWHCGNDFEHTAHKSDESLGLTAPAVRDEIWSVSSKTADSSINSIFTT